jgi:hypothetical protein
VNSCKEIASVGGLKAKTCRRKYELEKEKGKLEGTVPLSTPAT